MSVRELKRKSRQNPNNAIDLPGNKTYFSTKKNKIKSEGVVI
jgi:hypothetical protein